MSLSIVSSRAKLGLSSPLVSVEVHLSNGLPAFNIVGLPETAVKESKDRVRSALINSKFEFPNRRITVNLAPAELPKGGSRFDLAIAIGILAASEQIPKLPLEKFEFIGELALSGELRGIEAILPSVMACASANKQLIISQQNADEACLVESITVLAAKHLLDVTAHLHQSNFLDPWVAKSSIQRTPSPEIKEVIGQKQAKRALEIAACAGHHMLLYGPPGTGKSMLAARLPGILPSMTNKEALAVACVHSIAQKKPMKIYYSDPFAPHIIVRQPRLLWVVAAHHNREKYPLLMREFYFLMNYQSFNDQFWKCFASHWNQVRFIFPAPQLSLPFPPNFSF